MKEDTSTTVDIFYWAIAIITIVGLIATAAVCGVPLDFNFPSPEFIITAIFCLSTAIYIGYRIKSMCSKMQAVPLVLEAEKSKNGQITPPIQKSPPPSPDHFGKQRSRFSSFRGNNLSQTAPNL